MRQINQLHLRNTEAATLRLGLSLVSLTIIRCRCLLAFRTLLMKRLPIFLAYHTDTNILTDRCASTRGEDPNKQRSPHKTIGERAECV